MSLRQARHYTKAQITGNKTVQNERKLDLRAAKAGVSRKLGEAGMPGSVDMGS